MPGDSKTRLIHDQIFSSNPDTVSYFHPTRLTQNILVDANYNIILNITNEWYKLEVKTVSGCIQ